jgi:hypothetical protein
MNSIVALSEYQNTPVGQASFLLGKSVLSGKAECLSKAHLPVG